uniref:Chemokine interleukin-8-like domain-containing protein n=3 Tax=Ornithorhynchus anatinus TaxID=9258 RepID=F7F4F5_ORNAN
MRGPGLSLALALALTHFLISFHPGQALFPFPAASCCTELSRHLLKPQLLKKVTGVKLQETGGGCHLRAIVLHLGRRFLCIHPKNRSLTRWFEQLRKLGRGHLIPRGA